MAVAPTKASRWGVRGLQTGDSDMWVRDIERLDSADNTWLHEYVHTRQGYAVANDVRWFTEASASYYAALLTLEQNRIGFEAFRNRLALGMRTPDASAVLADPQRGIRSPHTRRVHWWPVNWTGRLGMQQIERGRSKTYSVG